MHDPTIDRLDADAMIAEAERTTGLNDWGCDEFRRPFSILIDSAER
jgi:hypothetical protein